MPENGIHVTVMWSSGPRVTTEKPVTLPAGATAGQAILASGLAAEFPGDSLDSAPIGNWGRRIGKDELLHDGDRIEIYRGLLVDPKVARRERFQKQGARSAGLFAKKRAGAKAGY